AHSREVAAFWRRGPDMELIAIDADVGCDIGAPAIFRCGTIEVTFLIDRFDRHGIEMTCVARRHVRFTGDPGRWVGQEHRGPGTRALRRRRSAYPRSASRPGPARWPSSGDPGESGAGGRSWRSGRASGGGGGRAARGRLAGRCVPASITFDVIEARR